MGHPSKQPSPLHDLIPEMEAFISVDVEASGPNPGQYSLLSIGACTVAKPQRTFYVELQPVNDRFTTEAMAINRLSLEKLAVKGLPPAEAMQLFEAWLNEQIPDDLQPIFVAFNAPFDWMFANDYFHRYLGHNPFGHKALDIKAFYMGLKGVSWAQTSHWEIGMEYLGRRELTHHALRDAMDEAEIFHAMLTEAAAHHNLDTLKD